ncbi:MAG: metal ABC transporter ATP-binding protein [Acutalibacteraceae bacterium]|nr:metal ABC transporter ATP-binding protein [Acutalibacteraceae bacterium]
MALIKCDNISLSYDGKTVISDLSVEIKQGQYFCIVGENGSGKSTLLKGILGLKKPSKGSITYGDGLTQNEIGYIPQQTNIQRDFPASVYEVVISGCINNMGLKPFYTKKEKNIALSNMERLGISELRHTPYNTLSGGQQQRVLLARALCATKKILLLDEPVAGLDPVVTAELYALVKKINDSGITIVMISHDLNGVLNEASHILQLNHHSSFYGTREEYFNSEIGKKFLGGEIV